jgi:hypothetical protein
VILRPKSEVQLTSRPKLTLCRMFSSTIEASNQAIKLGNPHWNYFRSLALALKDRGDEGDTELAVAQMETVLGTL